MIGFGRRSASWWLNGLVATSLLFAGALLFKLLTEPGLCEGSDVPLHIGNVVEAAYFLREGYLPPWDWLPDIAGGYGGPNFIYYGSLAFIFPAILNCLGLTPILSVKLTIGLAFVVGAATSYLFFSRNGSLLGGTVGAVLFLYGPYFFGLPYVRGAYPEFVAYALYPLLFYGVERLVEEGGVPWGCLAAFVFSLIIGVHTLSLLILVPFGTLYAAATAGGRWRSLARVFGWGAAALLLSAVFLHGPLLETSKVAIAEQFQRPDLYQTTGIPWFSLFNRSTLDDVLSHIFPGRLHLIAWAFAGGSCLLMADKERKRSAGTCAALAGVALLLCESTVAGVSARLAPSIGYLQFPWRFLGIFNLMACGAFSKALFPTGSPLARRTTGLACAVPLLCVLVYYETIPKQKVTRFATETREGIRKNLTTLDHENKYMPLGASLGMRRGDGPLLDLGDAGTVKPTTSRVNDHRFEVTVERISLARFHQYWFAGWAAQIDGKPAAVSQAAKTGVCELEVPAGVHEVRIHFGNTFLRGAAKGVSAATATVILALLFNDIVRRCRQAKGPSVVDVSLSQPSAAEKS